VTVKQGAVGVSYDDGRLVVLEVREGRLQRQRTTPATANPSLSHAHSLAATP